MPTRTLPMRDVTGADERRLYCRENKKANDLTLQPFDQACRYARTLGLRTKREWEVWAASDERPSTIPRYPQRAYADAGWHGWADFLHGLPATPSRYIPFVDARTFVHSLDLKSRGEWSRWIAEGKRPLHIPAGPNVVYADAGWRGWADWLGTTTPQPVGPAALPRKEFISFPEARTYARGQCLNSRRAWARWAASGACPPGIPHNPAEVYRASGWLGWPDFLGYTLSRPRARRWTPTMTVPAKEPHASVTARACSADDGSLSSSTRTSFS
jgi:hypothetical protein